MLVSEVVTRVLHQFGDEASVQVTEEDIIRYINDGLREIWVQNDIGQTTATMNSIINEDEYNQPDETMALRSVFYDNQKLKFISKKLFDDYIITSDPNQTQVGTPMMWTRWASQLILYPKPDSVKTIKIQYLRKPTTLTAVTDIIPLDSEYWNALVTFCLKQAYQTDEDWDAASQMDGQFQDGLTRLKQQETFADSVESYPTITVLEEDGGGYY